MCDNSYGIGSTFGKGENSGTTNKKFPGRRPTSKQIRFLYTRPRNAKRDASQEENEVIMAMTMVIFNV